VAMGSNSKTELQEIIHEKAKKVVSITGISLKSMRTDGVINDVWQGNINGVGFQWNPYPNESADIFEDDYFIFGFEDSNIEIVGIDNLKHHTELRGMLSEYMESIGSS